MTYQIQWMNFNGYWKFTPGPIYTTRKAADAALKMLGLEDNPAYRVVKV